MQKALKKASWDIPKTSIEGEYGRINSYNRDNSFTVSQEFSFPTLYINQNKLAEAGTRSAEWQLRMAELETATRVKQSYWQLAYLYARQQLLRYQDSLYTGFARAAELRSRTGESNRLEMITARSQSLEVKNHLQKVDADILMNMRKLATMLNTATFFKPQDTLQRMVSTTTQIDSVAVSANPSLRYMLQQAEVAAAEKRVENSRILPDFKIGYFSQTMQGVQEVDNFPRTFGKDDRFTGIQAGISIPLWFAPYTAKVKAAGIREQSARTDAGYMRQSLASSYMEFTDELTKCTRNLHYYQGQALPEAEMIINQSTLSYKAGQLDYLDYILSLGRALDIKQGYLDALDDYNQAVISLEFIMGKIF
jgi:heavy metal efflux system protein